MGLTGGIASGKSSVIQVFQQLGCAVIDVDVIARHSELDGAQCAQQQSPVSPPLDCLRVFMPPPLDCLRVFRDTLLATLPSWLQLTLEALLFVFHPP